MKRSIKIDFLRGICMFYVIAIFHLSGYLGEKYCLSFNPFGNSFVHSCLGTFTILSGYLLGKKYFCDTIKDAFSFYKKRLVRFWPLYLLSTILLWLIHYINLKQGIFGLLGMVPFVSDENAPLTLWYMSMIMFFYLLCPFVLTNNNKSRIVHSIILFLFFLILYPIIHIKTSFYFYLFVFLIGVCLSGYKDRIQENFIDGSKKKYLLLIILFYLFAFVNLSVIKFRLYSIIVDFLGIFVLIIISIIIKVDRYTKSISFLSYISMSFYLFHRFTFWTCITLFYPDGLLSRIIYLLFISVPVGMCFAYYIQFLYDKVVFYIQNHSILDKK